MSIGCSETEFHEIDKNSTTIFGFPKLVLPYLTVVFSYCAGQNVSKNEWYK